MSRTTKRILSLTICLGLLMRLTSVVTFAAPTAPIYLIPLMGCPWMAHSTQPLIKACTPLQVTVILTCASEPPTSA